MSQSVQQSQRALPPIQPTIDPMYSEVEDRDRQITTPLGIYQTIDDAQTQGTGRSRKPSDVMSAPSVTSGPTAPSVTSGPLSSGSQEEDLTQQAPDPNAIYAQVDIEKKRASRKHKKSEPSSSEHQPRCVRTEVPVVGSDGWQLVTVISNHRVFNTGVYLRGGGISLLECHRLTSFPGFTHMRSKTSHMINVK